MNELDRAAVRLRPQTNNDDDFLLQLYISTREAELTDIGWSAPEIARFLAQQFEAQSLSYRAQYPDAAFDIIEYQGNSIGRLYVERGREAYHLIDISLLPRYRGQGVGGMLIRSILEEASTRTRSVCLHVEQQNPARRLYERLGFVVRNDPGVYLFMQWLPG